MKIAICQMNPTIGAIKNNAKKILLFANRASKMGADLILTSELVICGYPSKDILLRDEFINKIESYLVIIAKKSQVPIIVGAPIKTNKLQGYPLWNAAVYCHDSNIKVIACKTLLPNYNVFSEERYFEQNTKDNISNIFKLNSVIFGITICEDAWNNSNFYFSKYYKQDPIMDIINQGASVILNLSASPFSTGKPKFRKKMFMNIAKKYKISVIVAGQVGANDQLIFDGSSLAVNSFGDIVLELSMFNEDLAIVDINNMSKLTPVNSKKKCVNISKFEIIENALVCGIRDYVSKSYIKGLVLGISGGLDSSLVATLAVKAIGNKKVLGVKMPSCFSSKNSLIDANKLVDSLSISSVTIPIESYVNNFRKIVNSMNFNSTKYSRDICDQNLQARVRANILMMISNLTSYILLNTSNKSELAMGYTTIYGDMCGALSPIGDLYKTDAYLLAYEINKYKKIIPYNILTKPPSAELKENQTDQDFLPKYKLLDNILKLYIDLDISMIEISKRLKISLIDIKKIVYMVNKNEHKRRQAPICLMISEKVFEISRRWPVVASFNRNNL